MTLFQIENGIGKYFVVAPTIQIAVDRVKTVLDESDYGHDPDRDPTKVSIIAIEKDTPYLQGGLLLCD